MDSLKTETEEGSGHVEESGEKKKRPYPALRGIGGRVTAKEIEEAKYYHSTNGHYPPGTPLARRPKIRQSASRFYLVKDSLFFNTDMGDPLLVIASEDMDRIHNILTHFHGEEHLPAYEMIPLVQMQYYGISREYITAWAKLCSICKNLVVGKGYVKRYSEVIKIVREPWFAICIFAISWSKLVRGKGGYILFVMDVYSRFTFYKELPYLDSENVTEYLESLFSQYGIPEILKISDEQLLDENLSRFCEEYSIQEVNLKDHPEHFISETSRAAEMQRNWLLLEINKNTDQPLDKVLEKAIRKQNFTTNDRGGVMKTKRIPCNVFFRRIVRGKKVKTAINSTKTYKIVRADLPSLIDLLPEDPISEKPKEIVPVKKRKLSEPVKIKEDKEIELEVRPSTEIKEYLTLYNPKNPANAISEGPLEEDHCVMKSFRSKGVIVMLISEKSFIKKDMELSQVKKIDIAEIAKRNNWPIDPPSAGEIWARRVDPNTLEFEPHRYWIIKQKENTPGVFKLYNIETKEIVEARQERICKAKDETIEKSKHLISFLFDKFNKNHSGKDDQFKISEYSIF